MITPPPWMADLPPLHHHRAKAFHGIPSPAACSWVEGRTVFSIDGHTYRGHTLNQPRVGA